MTSDQKPETGSGHLLYFLHDGTSVELKFALYPRGLTVPDLQDESKMNQAAVQIMKDLVEQHRLLAEHKKDPA